MLVFLAVHLYTTSHPLKRPNARSHADRCYNLNRLYEGAAATIYTGWPPGHNRILHYTSYQSRLNLKVQENCCESQDPRPHADLLHLGPGATVFLQGS